MCKVCGDTLLTSDELVAHIVQHCDENTAMRRQPQSGPRKYKRRRKLKHETPASLASRLNDSFDMLDTSVGNVPPPSDSDENAIVAASKQRKLGKKTNNSKQQHRANVEEGYQNVLKSFESSLQNINSIVSNSKAHPAKTKAPRKKIKREDKKTGLGGVAAAAAAAAAALEQQQPSTNHPGRPKMIHTQKTRVPVEMGTDGVKKGQKTKTMVTRTPKVMPNEQRQQQQKPPGVFAGSERNRPRTKNVSYHVEGRQSLLPATFPKPKLPDLPGSGAMDPPPPSIEMVNIKIEPGLQKISNSAIMQQQQQNHTINNNGDILQFKQEKIDKVDKPAVPRRPRGPTKKTKRKQAAALRKSNKQQQRQQQLLQQQQAAPAHLPPPPPLTMSTTSNTNSIETPEAEPTQLFESPVVDGNSLEVGYEANVSSSGHHQEEDMVQESILPDVNHAEEIGVASGGGSSGNAVKLNVKVESTADGLLDVHSLMGSVEESVPETIIPDTLEYTCEMCAMVFSTRAELLVHVPIHI